MSCIEILSMVLGVACVFWDFHYIPELCGIKEKGKNLAAKETTRTRATSSHDRNGRLRMRTSLSGLLWLGSLSIRFWFRSGSRGTLQRNVYGVRCILLHLYTNGKQREHQEMGRIQIDVPKHKFKIAKSMMIFAVLVLAVLLVSCASKLQADDKDPELVRAARKGDLNEVIRLLGRGVDVNAGGKYGTTPLMAAGHGKNVEIVKLLINKGADINAKDNMGLTVLMHAAWGGNLDVVKLLIEKGLDVKARNRFGETALMHAAWGGNLDVVKLLIEKGLDVKDTDHDGRTVLMSAAEGGNLDVVKFLIEKGLDVKDTDHDGWTVLMSAAEGGNLDVVKFLIEKGLNVKARNRFGETALMRAAQRGRNLDVVKLLIDKGSDADSTDSTGQTPLMQAAEQGNLAIVKLLVEKGADINAKENSPGTPTTLMSLVRSLIDKRISVVVEGKGRTALEIAREKGHKEIVEYLKAHGAKE